ncbi:MAG: hypothetical protein QOC77_2663 [Thermoleophilaceae bacterium]|jgi:hypothetical protein|nr:hypothetical protein [Thermoleophilaceae bacterium]
MNTRNGTLAVLTVALACGTTGATAAVPATAAPTKVTVRIEGKTKTIFEGTVTTDVHEVDAGDGSGPHKCDGTNGGANPAAGPTATGAMDDAVKLAGLTWSGSYDASFQDFLVNQVGPDAATSSQFWGVAVQGKSLQVGGCQAIVTVGDEVLWAYDSFGKKLLRASGPKTTRVGRLTKVKVIDTEKNKPVAGARIGGKKTNAGGVAKLRFKTPGTKRLKATASKAIRSNQLVVKVLKKK